MYTKLFQTVIQFSKAFYPIAYLYNNITFTKKLTGLCACIEKCACCFNSHRSNGAICYLCT